LNIKISSLYFEELYSVQYTALKEIKSPVTLGLFTGWHAIFTGTGKVLYKRHYGIIMVKNM
jgi:hypothetical protein